MAAVAGASEWCPASVPSLSPTTISPTASLRPTPQPTSTSSTTSVFTFSQLKRSVAQSLNTVVAMEINVAADITFNHALTIIGARYT